MMSVQYVLWGWGYGCMLGMRCMNIGVVLLGLENDGVNEEVRWKE